MRIIVGTIASALMAALFATAPAVSQTSPQPAGVKRALDLIPEIGWDFELDADLTNALGFAADPGGTWRCRQVGAFDSETDLSSKLHGFAIHKDPDTDVLLYTRAGSTVHFLRADRTGKALAGVAFDGGKRLEFSLRDAQAEANAELKFWEISSEETRKWWYCRAELGGSHPVQAADKIAGCKWVAEHEKNNPRAVSTADTNIGTAFVRTDETSEMKYLNDAVKVDPTNDNAWAQLCSAQNWVTHDLNAALASCSKVIELAPKSPEGWTYRGDIYLRDKKYEQAIADYDHALELAPQWMWPWDNRGEAYLRMGNPYRAILDFNEVVKTGPGYAMGYFDRGIAHLKLNDPDSAKTDFESGLKIDPNCGHCLIGRGLAELQKGDKAAGDADIAAGKKRSPKYAESFADDGITIP